MTLNRKSINEIRKLRKQGLGLKTIAKQKKISPSTVCKYCKEEIKPSISMKEIIKKELDKIPDDQKQDLNLKDGIKLFHGKGCSECKESGTSGRMGVYEILSMTPEIESKMSSKITESDISKEAEKQGMITMKQDGVMKALLGLTTIEEVLRITED